MKTLGFENKNAFQIDHILMGKQKKLVENFQNVNTIQSREGAGRMSDGQFD